MRDRFHINQPPGQGRLCAETQVKALRRVEAERSRQDLKWGTKFADRTLDRWHTILSEEVGEVAEAIMEVDHASGVNRRLEALQHLADEVTQVAAVAVSILEWLASQRDRI